MADGQEPQTEEDQSALASAVAMAAVSAMPSVALAALGCSVKDRAFSTEKGLDRP